MAVATAPQASGGMDIHLYFVDSRGNLLRTTHRAGQPDHTWEDSFTPEQSTQVDSNSGLAAVHEPDSNFNRVYYLENSGSEDYFDFKDDLTVVGKE